MKNETILGGATLWARQTIESEIFYDKPHEWFKIWFYLVNRVNWKTDKRYERGELFLKYEYITNATKTTKNQVDSFIRWAKSADMLSTQKTTRGMIVKITNYSKYQTLDNYYYDIKTDTETETEPKQNRNRTDTILKKEKKEKKEKNINNILQTTVCGKEIAEVINAFKEINPTITFNNKTNRAAAEELINQFGYDETMQYVKAAIAVFGREYAPVITNPHNLKTKLANLISFYQSEQNKQQKGGRVYEL